MADFCPHWFRLTHHALPPGGTNTIRQNESREASFDYLVENGGVIPEAVSTQVWSGKAAVHVSIVNWEKASAAELPGSTRVPRVGEGVPPSRTSAAVEEGSASLPEHASGSALRRDAATNTRDACAPRTCRCTFLQSGLHFDWFKARYSTLGGTFRYTSDTVFDTFPWLPRPARGQLAEVAAAAVALRALRREVMAAHGWSLRALYRTLDEPGDNPLRTAYGMPAKAAPLAFPLAINLTLAAQKNAGEPITLPDLPLPDAECPAFITDDFVRVTAPG